MPETEVWGVQDQGMGGGLGPGKASWKTECVSQILSNEYKGRRQR